MNIIMLGAQGTGKGTVAGLISGAMTITEISNLGKPSILVPLPNVSQYHQKKRNSAAKRNRKRNDRKKSKILHGKRIQRVELCARWVKFLLTIKPYTPPSV